MPLRIATIGKRGQTAQALAAAATGADITLVQSGSTEADLREAASLARFIDAAKPDVLINAGAYNFVDRAETEPAEAHAMNADGPGELARLCTRYGIAFIHMSTDLVFDGAKDGAYVEEDPPNPLSAYGRSKLAGERAVATTYADALTTRVCWVFSEYASNFVSSMMRFATERPVLRVVADQWGAPTYAPDLARALLRIARAKHDGASDLSGVLHLAGPEFTSRADMAREIMAESKRRGGPFADVVGVTTEEFGAPAKRPLNARLSAEKATRLLGLGWTPWSVALRQSVAGILAGRSG